MGLAKRGSEGKEKEMNKETQKVKQCFPIYNIN
jgi:hypothetical protein